MTWNNRRDGPKNTQERLNRGLASISWFFNYPDAMAYHLEDISLDHRLVLFRFTPNAIKAKKLFHFDNRWVENSETQQIIFDPWNDPIYGSHLSQAFSELKKYRHSLVQWNRQYHTKARAKIMSL